MLRILLILGLCAQTTLALLRLDWDYPLKLDSEAEQVYQLSNSSILVQYSNSTFVLYSPNFQYVSEFTILGGEIVVNLVFSRDDDFFTAIIENRTIAYTHQISIASTPRFYYDIDGAIFAYYETETQEEYSLIVTDDYVFLIKNTVSLEMFFQLSVQRNDLHKFMGCELDKRAILGLWVYCYTNQNELFQFSYFINNGTNNNKSSVSNSQLEVESLGISLLNHTVSLTDIFTTNRKIILTDSGLGLVGFDTVTRTVINFELGSNFIGSLIGMAYAEGQYYFLYPTKMLRSTYQQTQAKFLQSSREGNFSLDNVRIALTTPTFFQGIQSGGFGHQRGTKELYSFGLCEGNNHYRYSSQTCISAVCSVENCQICNLKSTICTVCDSVYVSLLYTCLPETCLVRDCYDCLNETFCDQCQAGFVLNTTVGSCQEIFDASIDYLNYSNNDNASNNTNGNPYSLQNQSDINNRTQTVPSLHNGTREGNSTEQTQILPTFDKTYLEGQYEALSAEIKTIGSLGKGVNSMPSLRVFLSFLSPLFYFFDDYWYYIYHDNYFSHLEILPLFLNFMYQMNKDRLFPSQLRLDTFQQGLKPKEVILERYTNFTNTRVLYIDQEQTYFQLNARSLLVSQYSIVLLLFIFVNLILRLFCFIFSKMKSCSASSPNLAMKLVRYLIDKSTISTLLVVVLEGNLIFLFFRSGLQLRVLQTFETISKFNMVLAIVCFFVAIMFALTFYLMEQRGRNSKMSVFYQSICKSIFVGCKNLAFGLIHSLLIDHNILQLVCLIMVKTTFLVIVINFGKIFKTLIIRVLGSIYFAASIIIDLLLIASKTGFLGKLKMNNYLATMTDAIQVVSLIFIVLSVVVAVLLQVLQDIRALLKSSNKVSNSVTPKTIADVKNQVKCTELFKFSQKVKKEFVPPNKVRFIANLQQRMKQNQNFSVFSKATQPTQIPEREAPKTELLKPYQKLMQMRVKGSTMKARLKFQKKTSPVVGQLNVLFRQ